MRLGGAPLAPYRRPHLQGAPARPAHAQEGGPGVERSRRPLESAESPASEPGLYGSRRLRVTLRTSRATKQNLPASLPSREAQAQGAALQDPCWSWAAPGALRAGLGEAWPRRGGPCNPFPGARSPPPLAPPRQLRLQLPLFAPPAWQRPGATLWASQAHLPSAAGEPCRWVAWR